MPMLTRCGSSGFSRNPDHLPVALVDHAEVHFGETGGSADCEGRLMPPMKARELVEIEIGKHVAV